MNSLWRYFGRINQNYDRRMNILARNFQENIFKKTLDKMDGKLAQE